tara:strand:- start:5962 stop:6501 length:540 start_codon:yes stop_codon:yes gene_type:complete
MCSVDAAMVGGKTLVDITKEQNKARSDQITASQIVQSNATKEFLAKENLKVKLASSVAQEAQKVEQAAKKIETARKAGRAEIASIIALNPFQAGRGNTVHALMRDSNRREAETKFSISNNLRALQTQYSTGRQIDIINTGTQIASLPYPNAIYNPALGIGGALFDNADKIQEQLERLDS